MVRVNLSAEEANDDGPKACPDEAQGPMAASPLDLAAEQSRVAVPNTSVAVENIDRPQDSSADRANQLAITLTAHICRCKEDFQPDELLLLA